jgi:hypothetical protein
MPRVTMASSLKSNASQIDQLDLPSICYRQQELSLEKTTVSHGRLARHSDLMRRILAERKLPAIDPPNPEMHLTTC